VNLSVPAPIGQHLPPTSWWQAAHVASIGDDPALNIPLIDPAKVQPVLPGFDLWDSWPVQDAAGKILVFGSWRVWMVLAAPCLADPDKRHDIARIRLMTEGPAGWRDCGDALPEGANPGSREWSGSCVADPATGALTLYYTVAGMPGEERPSFAQRLFQWSGQLAVTEGLARISWQGVPKESVASDGDHYLVVTQTEGTPGFIKGFRDPAYFRDPADDSEYLLFTASLAKSQSAWNGCIGMAQRTDSGWTLMPPLLAADGLNNEQERPHIIVRGGLYYLFWSTQRKVFAPGGPSGPNGLYGMVAECVTGPWRPLNGHGLVAANPPAAPNQAYSWWVLDDLSVTSFIDLTGVENGPLDSAAWRRAHFGGTPAPYFRIKLDGHRAWVVT
jgi:levansucrase